VRHSRRSGYEMPPLPASGTHLPALGRHHMTCKALMPISVGPNIELTSAAATSQADSLHEPHQRFQSALEASTPTICYAQPESA